MGVAALWQDQRGEQTGCRPRFAVGGSALLPLGWGGWWGQRWQRFGGCHGGGVGLGGAAEIVQEDAAVAGHVQASGRGIQHEQLVDPPGRVGLGSQFRPGQGGGVRV